VGDGSPDSREAEGEGGEGFYIGRCLDLLVIWGGGAKEITAEKALNIRTMIFRFKSDASNASIMG
jgi:hypothetical protein